MFWRHLLPVSSLVPKVGGSRFLRNAGNLPDYKVSKSRRLQSALTLKMEEKGSVCIINVSVNAKSKQRLSPLPKSDVGGDRRCLHYLYCV
jgi:hypothetical protein